MGLLAFIDWRETRQYVDNLNIWGLENDMCMDLPESPGYVFDEHCWMEIYENGVLHVTIGSHEATHGCLVHAEFELWRDWYFDLPTYRAEIQDRHCIH